MMTMMLDMLEERARRAMYFLNYIDIELDTLKESCSTL